MDSPNTLHPESLLADAVKRWRPGLTLEGFQALTPDASLRRYFRLTVGGGDQVVAMLFDSIGAPEAGGRGGVNSFEAYLVLSEFFRAAGVPVPVVLHSQSDPHLILLEDLGDELLGARLVAGGEVSGYYHEAIEIIFRLQRIRHPDGGLPFARAFSAAAYVAEMEEFTTYYMPGDLRCQFSTLAEEILRLPAALAHRDFHSWNLMIDPTGHLRVIDFQDALMATRAYDIVGLLNDRDTDAALGEGLYTELLRHFEEEYRRVYPDNNFARTYSRVLLQRDLKVVGRFAKLHRERGLAAYKRWIPGTVRRIKRTLERDPELGRTFAQLREIL